MKRTDWALQRKRLVEIGRLPAIFIDYKSRTAKASAALTYEPLLVSRHMQRLSEVVDKCLLMRKDLRELEILAVKAETDYDLFVETSLIDEKLNSLQLQIPSKIAERDGYQSAAAVFGQGTSLEHGIHEVVVGRGGSLISDINASIEMQALNVQRFKAVRSYQDTYHARYQEPGNAHNFGERAKIILEVLHVLMEEALSRARALSVGAKQIYGPLLTPPPASLDVASLDSFAVWALKTAQILGLMSEQETAADIIVPLVQPWQPSKTPLITQRDFDAAVDASAKTGAPIELPFTLPSNGFIDARTRIRGVGLSFGSKFLEHTQSGIDRYQPGDSYTRLLANVSTPEQTAADGSKYRRPSIVIGNVGLHGIGSSVIEGPSIENSSPFGKWVVILHPFGVWKDSSLQNVSNLQNSNTPISDLKLVLRAYVPGQGLRVGS